MLIIMGNNSSTVDVPSSSTSTSGTAANAAAATADRSTTPQRSRRIVKATIPSPSTSEHDLTEKANGKSDDDDGKPTRYYLSPSDPHTVPPRGQGSAVARELDDEQYEESRQERIVTMEKRQRNKREQKMQERRNNPSTTATKKTTEANPFSRFLSVFSVEPAHPEHKRAFEGDAEIEEPSGKKLRPSEENDENTTNKSALGGGSSGILLAAIGVATVAVILAVHLKKL